MRNKIKIGTVTFLTICATLSSGCSNFISPEPHSLKYDSIPFNNLAQKIISQNEIFQMDDFTRYYKFINNSRIRLTEQPEDNDSTSIYIDRLIDSLHLSRKLINLLKDELRKTKLREFYRSKDSVLFIVDGFLDHSWGYFYSSRKINNDTMPFQFGRSYTYVYYVYDVNEHWKKVAID